MTNYDSWKLASPEDCYRGVLYVVRQTVYREAYVVAESNEHAEDVARDLYPNDWEEYEGEYEVIES